MCIAVAMLYALSVFVPHFAHAYAPPQRTADPSAMSEHDHSAGAAHHHADGATHHHATAEHPTSHSKHGDNDTDLKCCAQVTLTVLPQQNVNPPFTGLSHSPGFPALVAKLTGRGAERLDRPPNV
jgi:hypothetical protein